MHQQSFNLPDDKGLIRVSYKRMRETAERVSQMIRDRAKQACREAGLDPSLLGIHPHNAMVSFETGHPWREVDYSKCRLTLRLLNQQWEPSRIVARWYTRLPSHRVVEVFKND